MRKRFHAWLVAISIAVVAIIIGCIVMYVMARQLAPHDAHFQVPTETKSSTRPPPVTSSPSRTSTGTKASIDSPSVKASPKVTKHSKKSVVATTKPLLCTGSVVGVVIPSLGVDNKTVSIGLESDGTLGTPSDKDRYKVGVYTGGPGPNHPGNVLMDGHTYGNGDSVFHADFGAKMKIGATIRLYTKTCVYTYDVDHVWPLLAKQKQWVTPTIPLFDDVVRQYGLYRGTGPSGLTLMTCSGKFDASLGHHQEEAAVHARLISISAL